MKKEKKEKKRTNLPESYKSRKYTPQFLKSAEEWIAENGLMLFGGALLKDYCKAMGIDRKTHYNYQATHKEYNEMIERGIETYRKRNTQVLYNSLMDAAKGGWRENVTEDTDFKPSPTNPDKPIIAKKRTHKEKRYVAPNVAAAIFLITNLDSESFINRQRSDVVVKETTAVNLSQEEARNLIKQLEEDY